MNPMLRRCAGLLLTAPFLAAAQLPPIFDATPLARPDAKGVFPAANGVQVQSRTVWVSNTARQLLLNVALGEDGRPGPVRVDLKR